MTEEQLRYELNYLHSHHPCRWCPYDDEEECGVCKHIDKYHAKLKKLEKQLEKPCSWCGALTIEENQCRRCRRLYQDIVEAPELAAKMLKKVEEQNEIH